MTKRVWAGVFVLLWMLALTGIYYASHKPFNLDIAIDLLWLTLRMLAAAGILSVAGGLGRAVLHGRWVPLAAPPVAEAVLQAALGFALLSPLVLLVGVTAGVNAALGWVFLAGSLLLLRKHAVYWWRSLAQLGAYRQAKSLLAAGCMLLTLLTLGEALLVALAPPVKFDALVYHLALPRAYLQAGRVVALPESWFWGMPQAGEMLYTWAMALVDERAAAVLGWMWGVLALAGLLDFTATRFGRRPAWVALAALLAGYSLAYGLGVAYVDWLAVLYGLAVLVTLETWWKTNAKGSLALAGFLAGAAAGAKLTAGLIVVCGLAVVIWKHRRAPDFVRRALSSGVTFLAPAGLALAPWLLKNLLGSGNALFPFLAMSDELAVFRNNFYRLPAWGNWLDVILLPLRASLLGIEGTAGYSATLGPLLVALAPLAFWPGLKTRAHAHAALQVFRVAALTGLLAWAILGRMAGLLIQPRLYFVLFPAFALLAGAGYKLLSRLKWPGVRLGRVAAGLILLIYGLGVFQMTLQVLKQAPAQAILGVISESEYREKNLGWYAPAMQAVSDLPQGARALLLWEPRSYDCLPGCSPDDILDRWIVARRTLGDAASIREAWVQAGFTHLLYYRLGADFIRSEDGRYSQADWQELDKLLGGLLLAADYGGAYRLYELTR